MLVRVLLSASTLSRSAFGILPNASLVGAKTVTSWALLNESTSLACLTAVTSVESTGLPEAAVATGTLAIASKLPALAGSVGTAEQPAPNSPSIMAGAELGAASAVDGAGAGAAAVSSAESSPQAETARARTA